MLDIFLLSLVFFLICRKVFVQRLNLFRQIGVNTVDNFLDIGLLIFDVWFMSRFYWSHFIGETLKIFLENFIFFQLSVILLLIILLKFRNTIFLVFDVFFQRFELWFIYFFFLLERFYLGSQRRFDVNYFLFEISDLLGILLRQEFNQIFLFFDRITVGLLLVVTKVLSHLILVLFQFDLILLELGNGIA